MMRKTYFEWREFWLSEGRYKGMGRKQGFKRPAHLPRPILGEWADLALFLSRRKKPKPPPLPPPVPDTFIGLYGLKAAFLNNPRGGVEDVAEMAAAGVRVLYLNVGDYSLLDWFVVRYRAGLLGILVIPWARCRTTEDVRRLCQCALVWGSESLVVNLEDEAKDTLSPANVASLLDQLVPRMLCGISTVVWLYNDVDWKPLARHVFMLQYFPAELPWYRGKLADCVSHALALGVKKLVYTYGTYWGAQPDWYDLTLPHSFFTGDTIGVGNWWRWR